jgi:hypothetical protein
VTGPAPAAAVSAAYRAEADAERGQARVQRDVDGVHQHERTQVGRGVEERVEHRVGQLDLADPRADLHAEEAQLADAALQLRDGALDVLQGHRAQREQPPGCVRDELGEERVLGGGQLRRPVGGLVAAEHDRRRETTCAATPSASMSRSRRSADQHRSSTSRYTAPPSRMRARSAAVRSTDGQYPSNRPRSGSSGSIACVHVDQPVRDRGAVLPCHRPSVTSASARRQRSCAHDPRHSARPVTAPARCPSWVRRGARSGSAVSPPR